MPPALPALAAIGGGSALAGGIGVAGVTAGLYGATKDRKSVDYANATAEAQRKASEEYIRKQTAQARSDIFKLFPAAQDSRQKGIQANMDFAGQALPLQMNTFQQGNNLAQQTMAQGLPQYQNAILGNPVQAPQPQSIDIQGIQALLNSAQLPQFQGIDSVMGQNTIPQQNIDRGYNPMTVPSGIGAWQYQNKDRNFYYD